MESSDLRVSLSRSAHNVWQPQKRSTKWWVKNTLMLGKTHLALKNSARAKHFLQEAAAFELSASDVADQQLKDEAKKLLSKL